MRVALLVALILVPLVAVADPPVRVRPTVRPPGQLDDLVERVAQRRGHRIRVHADDRTGRLIVVGNRRGQDVVEKLVRRLDRPRARRAPRIFVHRLQHAPAREIQEVLRALR